MKRRNVSRLAKRIFRPVINATEPMPLDLRGVAPMMAYDAIREVSELVRATDAPSPIHAKYVVTGGNASAFLTWWDRLRLRLGLEFKP